MSIVGGLVTLGLLIAIIRMMVSSRSPFSLTRAMQPAYSVAGPAVGRLLSILTIATVVTTASVLPSSLVRAYAIPAIIAVAAGAAVASALTDRVLAVFGIALAVATTVERSGAAIALIVLIIALLGTWLTGLLRGFTSR